MVRAGFSHDEIAARVRRGELVRLRRGAYSSGWESGRVDRHLQLMAGTMPLLDTDAVLSHFSAAVLHGLAVPASTLTRVWVTRSSAGGGKLSPQLHVLKAPLRPEDITVADGYVTTSLARTVVDLARHAPPEYGLAAADLALRRGLPRESLEEQIDRWPRRPGNRRARYVVERADGRSESFGESWSRLVMCQLGIPLPTLQVNLTVGGSNYRSDFGWLDLGLLGEFDGRIKYAELLRPGQTAADVVMEEKGRQEDLLSFGWHMVRWGSRELSSPPTFGRRLELARKHAAERMTPAKLEALRRTLRA